MKILVSACLMGAACRYDGTARPDDRVIALGKKHELIPVCPECCGGLPTPRVKAERRGDRVISKVGTDLTLQYHRGAEATLQLARMMRADAAILKEHSPACGHGQIYDGTFTKTLTDGDGVAAELLIAEGIPVFGESELDQLKKLSSKD